MATETERKFLIQMPSIALLLSQEGATESEITQTYLLSAPGTSARVRERRYPDKTVYTHTVKKRKTVLSAEELERTVTKEEYLSLLTEADPDRHPIHKRRITIPYDAHLLEIDIFPFWKRQAFLEIELGSEDEACAIPPFLTVLREVTADGRYKNAALAKYIPSEDGI